jgi:hypothetical protein
MNKQLAKEFALFAISFSLQAAFAIAALTLICQGIARFL